MNTPESIKIAKEAVCGFQLYIHIYIIYCDEQSSISHWFYTGKLHDITVNNAFVKVFDVYSLSRYILCQIC